LPSFNPSQALLDQVHAAAGHRQDRKRQASGDHNGARRRADHAIGQQAARGLPRPQRPFGLLAELALNLTGVETGGQQEALERATSMVSLRIGEGGFVSG